MNISDKEEERLGALMLELDNASKHQGSREGNK